VDVSRQPAIRPKLFDETTIAQPSDAALGAGDDVAGDDQDVEFGRSAGMSHTDMSRCVSENSQISKYPSGY
jgi:hypothetical protein